MIKTVLWVVGATIFMLWVLGSFIPDANSQDCDYVKIVEYKDGKIVNSKTEYNCETENEPEILVKYIETVSYTHLTLPTNSRV